jgi:hypothetical protein
MPFQVGPTCYPSEASAATAQASAMGGAVVQHGSAAYVVEVGAVTATSITYVFNPVGGGAALTLATPYNAQACQMLDWSDGLELGWAVAAVWIATTALLFIARALRGEPEHGNA